MNDTKTIHIMKQTYTNLLAVLGIGLLLLFSSCEKEENHPSSVEDGPTKDEIAHIYSHYTNRQFSEYVNHIASCKGKPRFYRELLINLYKQQFVDQEEQFGVIDSIHIERIVKSDDNKHAQVYIRHFYSKVPSEEVLLQMCYTSDGWKIK